MPGPWVLHAEHDPGPVRPLLWLHRDDYRHRLRRVGERVREQVLQELAEAVGIPLEHALDRGFHPDLTLCAGEARSRVLRKRDQVQRLDLHREDTLFRAAHVQQVGDQALQASRVWASSAASST
jgi:hypothetical protein